MIKVAIVEVNRTVRESLVAIVNSAASCRSVGAWGAAPESFDLLLAQKPDVVLLDLGLPDPLGLGAVQRIQRCLPDARILVLTVYEDPGRILPALRAGAHGYLLKRSTPAQILAAILAARDGRRGEAEPEAKTPHLGS